MSAQLIDFITAHAAEIQSAWATRTAKLFPDAPREAFAAMTRTAFEALAAFLEHDDASRLAALAEAIVGGDAPIRGPALVGPGFRAFLLAREAIRDVLETELDGPELQRMRRAAAAEVDRACGAYFKAYAEKRQQADQRGSAVEEFSTPVIQVWDQVLVLPLIGSVNSRRAQQVLDALLAAVVRTDARLTIIDVTGVPSFDDQAARHLIRALDAARMLGTEPVLTGVSPTNAQLLIGLDVDLTEISTCGTLKAGLQHAFDRLRLSVVRRQQPGRSSFWSAGW